MTRYIIGVTDDNLLALADVRLNEDNEFSCSFDTVDGVELTDDFLFDQADYLVECMDDQTYRDVIERLDCRPSELVNTISTMWPYEEYIDVSLYPHEVNVDDKYYIFLSVGSGQQELTFKKVVDPCVYDLIELWHNKHLKRLSMEELDKLDMIEDKLFETDGQQFVKDYIKGEYPNV